MKITQMTSPELIYFLDFGDSKPLFLKKKKLGCRVKHELNRLGQFANPFLTYIQMNTAQKYIMFCVVNTCLI